MPKLIAAMRELLKQLAETIKQQLGTRSELIASRRR